MKKTCFEKLLPRHILYILEKKIYNVFHVRYSGNFVSERYYMYFRKFVLQISLYKFCFEIFGKLNLENFQDI